MQQLRIMGVTEEDSDELLVLADEEGQEYALPVDEALRGAVGRRSTRPAHLTTRAEDARAPMTVREVQARLRAGASVEQMVAESGLDPARVERYAGPVQAERGYIAELARGTQVAPPSSAEQHRIAFGDAPATLEAMVKVRLRSLDVDLSTLGWDAWRRQDGAWQVLCWFDADDEASDRARVDAEPPAEWVFSPEARHLRAVGPWAQTLSSLPPETGSRRTPRRLTAVDAPFDVESAGDTARPSKARTEEARTDRPRRRPTRSGRPTPPAPVPVEEQDTSPIGAASPASGAARPAGPAPEGDEHEDLLDVLRARRGQRLGADEEADDRLALMLTRDEHPAEDEAPRLRAVDAERHDDSTERVPAEHEGPGGLVPEHIADDASPRGADGTEDPEGTDAWGFSYADGENGQPDEGAEDASHRASEGTGRDAETDDHTGGDPSGSTEKDAGQAGEADAASDAEHRPKPRRGASRRPNMPRWDDILFGSKGD